MSSSFAFNFNSSEIFGSFNFSKHCRNYSRAESLYVHKNALKNLFVFYLVAFYCTRSAVYIFFATIYFNYR